MKVYELMNALAELPSGTDIKIDVCLTCDELESGQKVDEGLYFVTLEIAEISGNGKISTQLHD